MANFEIQDGVLKEYTGNDTHVDIPEGVTMIGWYAFEGRKNLQSINIPNGVTVIGYAAFLGCTKLQSVKISDIKKIKKSAFADCISLKKATIPIKLKGLFNLNLKKIFGKRYKEIAFTFTDK